MSSGDDNQTYVVTTAALEQRTPEVTAADYDRRIRRSLQSALIGLDTFNRPDAPHADHVGRFFSRLLSRGSLIVKETPCLHCEDCNTFLFEAYVGGTCPTCLESTRGNICEACGHPNDPVDLIDPHCTVASNHRLSRKTATGLFLPLERHREALERLYASANVVWRTHLMQFVRQVLAKPLADFRLTYPTRWGIPVDLPGLQGQKFNAWGEMLPGLLNSFALAGRSDVADGVASSGTQLVQFFGFDNSYFFAFVHVALLFECGPQALLPTALISNEFYELENLKFSTSLKHAIWVGDFLDQYDPDAVRLFLCATNPELQRTNFVESQMRHWLEEHLLRPWKRLRECVATDGDTSAVDLRLAIATQRIECFYGMQQFSLRQAAGVIVQTLRWLSDQRAAATPAALAQLSAMVAPIMPRFAGTLARSLGLPDVPRWQDRQHAAAGLPATLPFLSMELQAP